MTNIFIIFIVIAKGYRFLSCAQIEKPSDELFILSSADDSILERFIEKQLIENLRLFMLFLEG